MPSIRRAVAFAGRRLTFQNLVLVGVGAVLCQNLIVVKRNASLNRTLDGILRETVQRGDRIPMVSGVDLKGHHAEFRMEGARRPTLLISMSTNCRYSQASLAAWRRLAASALERDLSVAIVVRDPFQDASGYFGRQELIPGVMIADPTYSSHVYLRMGVVPVTRLVQPDSSAGDVWIGGVTDEVEGAVALHDRRGCCRDMAANNSQPRIATIGSHEDVGR